MYHLSIPAIPTPTNTKALPSPAQLKHALEMLKVNPDTPAALIVFKKDSGSILRVYDASGCVNGDSGPAAGNIEMAGGQKMMDVDRNVGRLIHALERFVEGDGSNDFP
jgi:hypothetical protein